MQHCFAPAPHTLCTIHVPYMYHTCTIHVPYMYHTCTIHVPYVHVLYMYHTLLVFVLQGGLSPLMVASWKGHLDAVMTLIEAGADVNQADKVSTCMALTQ